MPPVRFRKVKISSERYESAGVFDVNRDGHPDIVSGAYWYPGPEFKEAHWIGSIQAVDEWYDDFSTIPLDVNGDGYPDFVTGGWWGNTLRWRENPKGDPKREWPEHVIAEVGNIETTRAWDVDGDGIVEIVPNTPGGPFRVFKLILGPGGAPAGKFIEYILLNRPSGHGFGFGDISGDRRGDFVLAKGWLESPRDPFKSKWTFHDDEFDLGSASCPVLVADVNGDGVSDLIVGQAHGYGLDWWEQRIEKGKRKWVKHPIDPDNSQYHDMFWIDIDGDGKPELVTGKRYRAHNGKDPGWDDPLGLYYFKWNGEGFVKHVIDWGTGETGGGCGIHFAIADVNGDGKLDIVAPGKDGLFLYLNQGCGTEPDR